MRSTSKSAKSGKLLNFLRLLFFSSLVVACYLVGFFILGPAYRKLSSTQDLRVVSRDEISMPRNLSRERSTEPPVQVTQRKLPSRNLPNREEPSKDNDIRLEIEQPLTDSSVDNPTQPEVSTIEDSTSSEDNLYRVEATGFADEQSASQALDNLSSVGYTPIITKVIIDGVTEYRVQVGAFKNKDNAQRVADDIRSHGYQVNLVPSAQ